MTVKITRPSIDIRGTLDELNKPSGIAGNAMLAAETPQEQFNLIGAGRKNLIINGGFDVWQRGTSFTGLYADNFIADRWRLNQNVSNSALADSAIVTGPTAGTKAIEVTVATAAASLTSSSYCTLRQSIEGSNFTPASSFGSSDAKELTLSFWHKHSIAGTYSIILRDSLASLNLLVEYAQTSADVWERTVLRIPAATVGTFHSDTQLGFGVEFTLTNGTAYQSSVTNQWFSGSYYHSTPNQTQMFLSAGSKFRIAQVQLELGSVATPFEHRSYGEELALCQRYYERINGTSPWFFGHGYNNQVYLTVEWKVPKRVSSGTVYYSDVGAPASMFTLYGNTGSSGAIDNVITNLVLSKSGVTALTFYLSLSSAANTPYGTSVMWRLDSTRWIAYDAEI